MLAQGIWHFIQNEKSKKNDTYSILKKFYQSFFSDMYNELNIGRYRQIRDAIGLVINKFVANDHPMAYASKLVLYIQARCVKSRLKLTKEQQLYLRQLEDNTKHVNVNYVYSGPIDSIEQFAV